MQERDPFLLDKRLLGEDEQEAVMTFFEFLQRLCRWILSIPRFLIRFYAMPKTFKEWLTILVLMTALILWCIGFIVAGIVK